MTNLHVTVGERTLAADWLDGAPELRESIAAALPVEGEAARWGDELYLHVDVEVTPTRTTREVPPGTLAYWPDGPALCLFWGPTPASSDDTPVAASPVAAFAMVDDVPRLAGLEGSAIVRIESA